MTFEPRRVVVIAGPNGSGKSELTRELRAGSVLGFPFPAEYINADEIAAELRRQNDPDPERSAFRLGRDRRRDCREAGVSFAYETVLSHPSGLLDLQLLCAARYELALVVVLTADPDINVARVARRVASGGHDVPEDRIRDRYARCLSFLPRALELARDAWVFDTTDQMELCLEVENGPVVPGSLPPAYIQTSLVEVLRQREADRNAIATYVEPGGQIELPDELQGRYEGEIVIALPTAYLQRMGFGSFVRHDASLFKAPLIPGQHGVIQYEQGYGGPAE